MQSLNRIFGVLGFDRLDRFELYRWNRAYVPGAKNSYAMAEAALAPLLNRFLTDDDVPDRDAVLFASPARETSGFGAFLQKLKAFFTAFTDILKKLLSFGGKDARC